MLKLAEASEVPDEAAALDVALGSDAGAELSATDLLSSEHA